MSLWRRTRTEAAGVWRSLRYDLGRRPSEPPGDGPDVTSTGMNTFGGQPVEPAPAPRGRALAVSAFGLLTVAGATGAYLAVANGLVPLLDESPAAAGTLPATSATANSGIGAGPAPHKARTTEKRAKPEQQPAAAFTRSGETTATAHHAPPRTTKPIKPKCPCGTPPAPTPTAPDSPASSVQPDNPAPTGGDNFTIVPSSSDDWGNYPGFEWPQPRNRHRHHH